MKIQKTYDVLNEAVVILTQIVFLLLQMKMLPFDEYLIKDVLLIVLIIQLNYVLLLMIVKCVSMIELLHVM